MFIMKIIRSVRAVPVIIAAVLMLHGPGRAEPAGDAAADSPEALQKAILDDKALLREEIKKAEGLLAGAAGDEERRFYAELLDQLQNINVIYEQQLVQVKRSPELSQALEKLEQETARGAGEAAEASYPFSSFDELGDRLFLLEEQALSFDEALKSADEAYLTARDKVRGREQEYRRVREEHETRKQDPLRSPAVMIARWSGRLAEEELKLRKLLMENERIEQAIHRLKIAGLQSKIAAVREHVKFPREELDGQLAGIDQEIAGLRNRLEQAKEKKVRAELRWRKAAKQPAREDQSPVEAEARDREIESLRLWYDASNARVMAVGQLMAYRNDLKKIWQHRYELFHNTPQVDIPAWQQEISQALKQLEQVRQKVSGIQTGCLKEIIVKNEALASADRASKISLYLEEQIRAIKEREGLVREFLEAVGTMEWEYKRLLADIQSRESRISLAERINRYGLIIARVWRYELTSADDRPITVGKIITAVLLLIIGYFLSKHLTLQMGKQMQQRFAVDHAAAFAWQQIVHYLLLVLLLLFVLNLVRIPLTFFTVVGGALAIGVGFGSQTIVNNFLSGLILMLERPIKIGDIVEVENVRGTVEWVGARSTRIKTFDHLRLVVPNSLLLQNKIINWNLTDDIVKRQIAAGVMYGSSVRRVEALLRQAADEQPLVERFPEAQVLFSDFGESAMIFVLNFWISLGRTGKAGISIGRVESDIRFRILELFHQEGIAMAYPQRDVRIDSARPIEIRLKQGDQS